MQRLRSQCRHTGKQWCNEKTRGGQLVATTAATA
jgi:hypothetical protein